MELGAVVSITGVNWNELQEEINTDQLLQQLKKDLRLKTRVMLGIR